MFPRKALGDDVLAGSFHLTQIVKGPFGAESFNEPQVRENALDVCVLGKLRMQGLCSSMLDHMMYALLNLSNCPFYWFH